MDRNPEQRLEDDFQHINICYSDLAAPMDSSLLLRNPNGPNALTAGALGPRYVQIDELLDGTQEPDARSRFVYDDFPHVSAKKIAKLFIENLSMRKHAASVIEKYYQFYRARCKFVLQVRERHKAAATLQRVYRRKIGYVRRRKAREKLKNMGIVLIQSVIRRKLAYFRVDKTRNNMYIRRLMKLRIWIRKHLHNWRYKRRKKYREYTHARRIQAFIRGNLWRKQIELFKKSISIVMKCWRRYWNIVYRPFGKQILHSYRNMWLHKKVKNIQTFCRKFLALKAVKKQQTRLIVMGRMRSNDEVAHLNNEIKKVCVSRKRFYEIIGFKVSSENRKFMKLLRIAQASTNALLADRDCENPDIRLTKAVFMAFANPTTRCIDSLALEIICRQSYLRFKHGDSLEKKSIFTSIFDKRGYRTGEVLNLYKAFTLDEIINDMQPTRILRWRVYIQGNLPDQIFVEGLLCSHWISGVSKMLLEDYRGRDGNRPYRYCVSCYEPMNTEQEWKDHVSDYKYAHRHSVFTTFNQLSTDLVNNDFICPRKNLISWLSAQRFHQVVRNRLLKECNRNRNQRFSRPTQEDMRLASEDSEDTQSRLRKQREENARKVLAEELLKRRVRIELQIAKAEARKQQLQEKISFKNRVHKMYMSEDEDEGTREVEEVEEDDQGQSDDESGGEINRMRIGENETMNWEPDSSNDGADYPSSGHDSFLEAERARANMGKSSTEI